MAVTRFEDLIAWQRARELTRLVYQLSRAPRFARDFGLASQIQRASVSVMSNIAEGFERSRPTEFHQFLSVAKASCAEVRSLLYVAHDIGYISDDHLDQAQSLAQDVSRIVGKLRARVAEKC